MRLAGRAQEALQHPREAGEEGGTVRPAQVCRHGGIRRVDEGGHGPALEAQLAVSRRLVSGRRKRAIATRFVRWKRTTATISAVIDAASSEAGAKGGEGVGTG